MIKIILLIDLSSSITLALYWRYCVYTTVVCQVCDTLTSVKKVNKTDAVTLLSTFGVSIIGFCYPLPCAGSGVVRIDSLHFLARCRTRWLNQALSVLSLSVDFWSVSVVLLTRATFCVVSFCAICVFCLLVVLVRLSVPVQMIDWKDSVSKMTYKVLMGTLNPTQSTHFVTNAGCRPDCFIYEISWPCICMRLSPCNNSTANQTGLRGWPCCWHLYFRGKSHRSRSHAVIKCRKSVLDPGAMTC